ncbi:MAG: hypothetical protein AUJ54_14950 [Ignavibacteria bacterium CG1_02_37_35]|nr:MAG: hypothetical protein AUJ54_14950 [Ignavibacteria bacterium CG1_02_37_35]
MKPTKITTSRNQQMEIKWEDNSVSGISFETLRKYCPCATCDEEREKQTDTYIPLFMLDQVSLDSIVPVGNYGITLTWKDGHSTGIYEYPYLLNLTEKWL